MYFVDAYGTEAPNIHVMPDGHAVARSSDFIVFSVEAEFIEKVVAEYGPCTLFSLLPTLLSTRKF
jgi:hypothetical protein